MQSQEYAYLTDLEIKLQASSNTENNNSICDMDVSVRFSVDVERYCEGQKFTPEIV